MPKSSDDNDDNVTDDWKLESKETETKEEKNRSDDMKAKQAKGDEMKDTQKETNGSDTNGKKETIVDTEKSLNSQKVSKQRICKKKLKDVTKLRRKRQ